MVCEARWGRFVEGVDRNQATLLPERLEDFIAEDNPIRIVDAFVDELDLESLGFEGAMPASTGRPSYHPGVMLKIYIYGYLNRVQSSRRLERECQHNVELMWLTGRLMPDFKTIAEFRRSNGEGIRNVCRRFVVICRGLKLFTQAAVAIDSSKFKAVNSRDENFTPNKIERRQEQIEQSIQRYLDALETADRTQPAEVEAKTERLREKIETLREQMRSGSCSSAPEQVTAEKQVSLTDPDSRSMISQAKGTGVVGYNVQVAVDTKHHLVVTHEVNAIAPMHAIWRAANARHQFLCKHAGPDVFTQPAGPAPFRFSWSTPGGHSRRHIADIRTTRFHARAFKNRPLTGLASFFPVAARGAG